MKSTCSRFLLASTSAAALFACMPAASAQTTGNPAPQSDQADGAKDEGIGDIIVTATRTETSAQKTPIAINVYSGDALRDQGVATVRDLSLIDPSVNVSNTAGAAYVAVRGVASTDFTEIGDPSVPISRDGFFTNRSFSINSSMYDVARIEVLKGPQGTLQGRNSTGGVISIITNRPEMANGGYASIEAGNYGTFNGEMGANLKLTDDLAIRASGLFNHHDGYRRLAGPGRYGDDEDFASGRIQALFKSGGFSLWASYQHDSRDVNGDAVLDGPIGGPRPSFDTRTFANTVPIFTKLEGDRYRWETSYAAGGLNFIYAGGYDTIDWSNRLSLTGPAYSAANRQFRQTETPKTWNHEFRISNDKGSKLFFQAGYFRFSENNSTDSGVFNLDFTGPFAVGGPLAGLALPNTYGIKFDYRIKTISQAVFGQVEYKLTDKLQLSLGGRYTWDKKVRTGQAVLFIPALSSPFAPPITIVNPGNGKTDEGKPTWHVGLNYQATDSNLLYAKYDRGYKAGGFNSNGSGPSIPYGAETVDSFEIGSKNSFLGNNLRVNLSAFYFKYKGYQATQNTGVLSGGSGIFNVGGARIFGIEGEVVARIASATQFSVNASLLDTRFDDNLFALDNGTNTNFGGNQLPNAPTFTASASLQHTFNIGSDELTARVDGRYSSKFYYSIFNDPDTRSEAYALVNASLKYAPADQPWQIQLYVRNAFDKKVLAFAGRDSNSGVNNYQFQPPRTYGVRGSVKF